MGTEVEANVRRWRAKMEAQAAQNIKTPPKMRPREARAKGRPSMPAPSTVLVRFPILEPREAEGFSFASLVMRPAVEAEEAASISLSEYSEAPIGTSSDVVRPRD